MKRIAHTWWPDDVADQWRHALRHLGSIEWAIAWCTERGRLRTAVQAGGNVGLWPRRLAEVFARVVTFEPDDVSREALRANVSKRTNVEVRAEALGASPGRCAIKHKSLGSHRVIEGGEVAVVTVDSLGVADLDYLQLDIEGYEHEAIKGARETIMRCRPLIQLELRGYTEKYGSSDKALRAELTVHGYREVMRRPGADVVFAHGA